MISDDFKYFCLSGDIPIGGPSTWHVVDWDQRRVVSVTMDGEQDDDSLAIRHFRRHASSLPLGTHRIYVSHTGEIVAAYSDADNDPTYCVHYPFLHDIVVPEGIQTVQRDELEELDRLGPDVDLVSYPLSGGDSAKKVVFKYYFLYQYAQSSWKEMNLWMRLPRHPNIVPFDRIVIDELEDRVVGFTNLYIPSGNLEDSPPRKFKLQWLRDLISVVDDLNLRYGIAHQDVAPRNLLVDESRDSIMIFDFNYAARINCPSPNEGESYEEERNDVKGVIFTVYEIITRDRSLREKPHEEQNLDDIDSEWTKHPEVQLDHPIASYRLMLKEWREQRGVYLSKTQTGVLPDAVKWPVRPKLPPTTISTMDEHGQPRSLIVDDIGDALVGATVVPNTFSTAFILAMTPWIVAIGLKWVLVTILLIAYAILMFFEVFIQYGKTFRGLTASRYEYYAAQQYKDRAGS